MRKKLCLVPLALLAFGLSAQAAIYLQIEGIRGESMARDHAGAIPVQRFNLELIAPNEGASGSGMGAGKLIYKPLVITKEIDACTPLLMHALVTKEVCRSVTLELAKGDGSGRETSYYTVKLKDAVISDVRQYTDDQTKANLEDISITYSQIEVEGAPGSGGTPPKPVDTPNFRSIPFIRPK